MHTEVTMVYCETGEKSTTPSSVSPSVSSAATAGGGPTEGTGTARTLNHPHIRPIFPKGLSRYRLRETIAEESRTFTLPPGTRTGLLNEMPGSPSDWLRLVHPTGAPYYAHQAKASIFLVEPRQHLTTILQRVTTDANLIDDGVKLQLAERLAAIEDYIRTSSTSLPDDYELVLDHPKDTKITGYYFIDHAKRSVFFLGPRHTSDLEPEWNVAGSRSRLEEAIELTAQYWYHIHMYPTSITLTPSILDEARDMLLLHGADLLSDPISLSLNPVFTSEEVQASLQLVAQAEDAIGTTAPGTMCTLARILSALHFSKLSRATNYRRKSLSLREGDAQNLKRHETVAFKIFSSLLFSFPSSHLKSIEVLGSSATANHATNISSFFEKISQEWLVAAGGGSALLFIGARWLKVVEGNNTHRGLKITAYLSLIQLAGSIVLGLLLRRAAIRKQVSSPLELYSFLHRRLSTKVLGWEPAAILFSLPAGLLGWGFITFVGSFGVAIFSPSNTTTRTVVGSASTAMGLFVLWGLAAGQPSDQVRDIRRRRPVKFAVQKATVGESVPEKSRPSGGQEDESQVV